MSDNIKKVVSLVGAREKDASSPKKRKPAEKTDKKDTQEVIYCSFCGRPNHLVIKMIKGPGVNICSECIMVCVQYFMIEDRLPSSDVQKVLDSFWHGVKK